MSWCEYTKFELLGSSGLGPVFYHDNDIIMGPIASQITSLTIVYSTVYPDADQRKHQSSASLAFVRGIHRGPVNSSHRWPVTRKMLPFDDVIMVVCVWAWSFQHLLININIKGQGYMKLAFEMLTVRGQQHSFSTHERMFLGKCQSSWDRNVSTWVGDKLQIWLKNVFENVVWKMATILPRPQCLDSMTVGGQDPCVAMASTTMIFTHLCGDIPAPGLEGLMCYSTGSWYS